MIELVPIFESGWRLFRYFRFKMTKVCTSYPLKVAACTWFTYTITQDMPRHRKPSFDLSSVQVARILNIAPKTLYRMLSDGRIPEPPRDPMNNYRQWNPYYVQQLKEAMEKND